MPTVAADYAQLVQLHHRSFLTILPRIELHARIYFRRLPDTNCRQDAIAETVALAWKWFQRLAERDKDGTRFASTLASFAARAVAGGRRVGGQEALNDVLAQRAQRQRGFTVSKLPDFSTLSDNPLVEALHDNTRTPPPDAAAFRLDWPTWLEMRSRRDRRLIHDMALGERTNALAAKYRLSAARVSQLRRAFCEDWAAYTA